MNEGDVMSTITGTCLLLVCHQVRLHMVLYHIVSITHLPSPPASKRFA